MEETKISRLRILAAAGVVSALAVGASFALFSDVGTVRTSLSSGSLDLKFDDDQDGNPEPYVRTFDGGSNLAPGSVVSEGLIVFNSGTVDASLDLAAPVIENASAGPDLLQNEITLVITDTATSTVLYNGPLVGASFASLDIGADGTTLTGRELNFTMTVAPDAEIGIAGQTVQVDFPFTATQTVP